MAMCVLRNAHAALLIWINDRIINIINITNNEPTLLINSSHRKGGEIKTPTTKQTYYDQLA